MKEEMIDIVDANGESINLSLPRSQVHKDGLFHNEIVLWVINSKNNTVLLQRRSPNKASNPNKLAVCAGHVSAGETVLEALYKEAQEEIGINLDEYNFSFLDKVKVYSPTNCCFSHHYYIDAEISLDEFVIQKEELSEVLYMDYEKLKNLAKNNDSSIVFQWKEPYINIFNKLDELFSK